MHDTPRIANWTDIVDDGEWAWWSNQLIEVV